MFVAWGRFRPMPRMLANLATVAAVLFAMYQRTASGMPPVMLVGEFLLCMQLIKLWEQRANRDWALLLVLSLLLMVAAAMNTASLWFGILLAAYLILSLYCCLLFHLKVETDAAMKAMPVPQEKLSPTTLRQDQRYLGRSMQRLTGMVAVFSVTFAVFVFVIFPRGTGGGMLGPMRTLHSTALTGFADQVEFQDVAKITQSHERIAFVKLFHNGKLVEGTQPLLLRGTTLDRYQQPPQLGGVWQWTRSTQWNRGPLLYGPGDAVSLGPKSDDTWLQQITLWPTQSTVLFAMPGPAQFTPRRMLALTYSPGDQSLQTPYPLNDRLEYEVVSTNKPQKSSRYRAPLAGRTRTDYPRIFAFARRPQVCGSNARGSLGDQRVALGDKITALDGQIASNIEHYLRTNFSYTLDLTDEDSIRGQDPLEVFLYKWKRGHCEYFAGAMTLMCQTLGMHARMVVGFHCGPENYNSFTQSYTVFDSDAHAWVEVETPNGWETFDPTSSRTYDPKRAGLMGRLRNLMEFLEFNYANDVVAYDAQNRQNLITAAEAKLTETATRAADAMSGAGYLIANSSSFWDASSIVLTCVVLLMVGVLAVAFGWFLWERWRLLRRAQRIGIESLPEDQQLRLARQLGFYDELLRLLERHRIVRPAHFTPLEFSRSLTFLPAGTYDTIQRLTRLFYEVRYGGVEMSPPRQRHLGNVLARLHNDLEANTSAT
ncbi:MAG TPA: DUF3488 and transglutaminase-like domain-containing protein, partial [Tepidisphaeraceae bacterium]|nr:DUF3488 and transglutaminase-like domain-containing protein [Tepidisphaeraceae bacterium]